MGTIYRDVDSFPGTTFEARLKNAVGQCECNPSGTTMIIVIPEGQHDLLNPIYLGLQYNTVPFTIIGQPSGASSSGTSIINAPNGFIKNFNGDNAAFITLQNLAIHGGDNNNNTCIDLEGRWIRLRDISISGFNKGIKISGAYNYIDNVEINTCSCGIEVTPVGTIIQNCHIHSCVDYGIRTLRGSGTNPSNALNIIGLIAESNGTSSYGAQIEINETDYVTITNSYIGDDSTCAIKNIGGTHVKIANMLQSIGGSHEAIVQTGGSIECSGEYYCPDKNITGIQILGGTADFTNMKVHLSYSFIQRTGGNIFMNDSKYQNGYTLSGSGDGTTKPSSFNGTLISAGNNFMGLPKYSLWSKAGSTTINTYTPGVCYKFSFPKNLLNKTIYLHFGIEELTSAGGVDCFLYGATILQPISNFLAQCINVITGSNNHRFRFTTEASYFNIPVTLDNTTLHVTIAAPGLQGMGRDKVVTIAFVYANEDNRFNIPIEWALG